MKAEALLHLHNMVFVDGSIEGPGNTVLVAGNNVQLSGWGALDGTYLSRDCEASSGARDWIYNCDCGAKG